MWPGGHPLASAGGLSPRELPGSAVISQGTKVEGALEADTQAPGSWET